MPFDYAPQVDFIKKMDALLIDNLYMDIGNHILSEGLKWKGAWPEDKTPSGLAKGILKKCLRSELELDFGAIDITEATFKNKSEHLSSQYAAVGSRTPKQLTRAFGQHVFAV